MGYFFVNIGVNNIMENKKVSISLPYPSFLGTLPAFLGQLKKSLTLRFHELYDLSSQFNQNLQGFQTTRRHRLGGAFANFNNFKNKFNNIKRPNFPKKIILIIPAILIIALVLVAFKSFSLVKGNVQGTSDNNYFDIEKPLKAKTLNKQFNFSLKDNEAKEVGKFKYIIESAEIRNEIIVKAQKATAVKGRTFLIVNLKLVNDLKTGININSRDYIRLTVNKNGDELLAADVHNDPVEVQAISTKYSRLGFAINTSDKNPTLLIGEINGAKQRIELNF